MPELRPWKQEESLTFLSILQSLRCFHVCDNSLSNVRFIIISELNNYYFPLLCRLANDNSDAQRLNDVQRSHAMKQLREGTNPGLCSSGWGEGHWRWAGCSGAFLSAKLAEKATSFMRWFWEIEDNTQWCLHTVGPAFLFLLGTHLTTPHVAANKWSRRERQVEVHSDGAVTQLLSHQLRETGSQLFHEHVLSCFSLSDSLRCYGL